MFDRDRLFRVLFHLSVETNDFLVAQDAYEIIRSCINQIRDVKLVLAEMEEKLRKNVEDQDTTQREQILGCVDRLLEVQNHGALWITFLNPLLAEAREFWFCSPVDHTHCVGENKTPMKNWRQYKEEEIISDHYLGLIKEFKNHCTSLIDIHFPDLLSLMKQEEELEQSTQNALPNRTSRFLNTIPLALVPEFFRTNHSFFGSTSFPRTHNSLIDPKFAQLLGYSIARVLCFPAQHHVVNHHEKQKVTEILDAPQRRLTSAQFFYRTSSREIVGVQLEISPAINGVNYAVGFDITKEIEVSKAKHAASIEKMLKQWLHSIRNASFEQQARVILEEVEHLENKVNRSDLKGEFETICECVKLLIHTARTSVGLIDQAIESRGLTQNMSVSDFVNTITSFPHHFAQSEGISAISTRYQFLLNGSPAQPQDYSSFFVTGDVISIQSMVDNILSNAVRYTDPILGIFVTLSLVLHQTTPPKLSFNLEVTDFASGGLPSTALKFLRDNIGTQKCHDEREKEITSPKMVSKGRSTRTGLSHMVELYRALTTTGSDDFNMTVTTRDTGSTFRIQFILNLLQHTTTTLSRDSDSNSSDTEFQSPTAVAGYLISLVHLSTFLFSFCYVSSPLLLPLLPHLPLFLLLVVVVLGTLLVVDDSMVIRKIISRYLHSFQCVHKVCSDGVEAWEWFLQNHSNCAGVITDLEMPKMGGDALLAKIHELCPRKPCFIVSGNDIPPEKLPIGALRAIVKPVAVEEIEAILCEIHNTQQLTQTSACSLNDCP